MMFEEFCCTPLVFSSVFILLMIRTRIIIIAIENMLLYDFFFCAFGPGFGSTSFEFRILFSLYLPLVFFGSGLLSPSKKGPLVG